jgi:putative transposase
MAELTPSKVWWTATEIADARLPGLPFTKRRVNALADRERWRAQPKHARRREGRGGGWEYHWTLFPSTAQRLIVKEATSGGNEPKPLFDRDAAWTWYDSLPEKPKAEAKRRLAVIQAVEMLVAAGEGKYLAVIFVAKDNGVSERTIWNWFDMVEGVRVDDRLPYLAPRHRAGRKAKPKSECTPEWWDTLKSDYLRPEQPSFSACYRRAKRIAEMEGWEVLPERTARRRFDAEVSQFSQVLSRKGTDALKALYPPQTRDKTHLHALEMVNADFHRFDVFVRWPVRPGSDEVEIVRPQMVAFQDIYSGRILSWRVDRTPNKSAVSLAFGDMVEEFGIPDHVVLDNGREFANKYLTGQTTTRNRFKIKDDDIPGLLVGLGIEIHWALPYSGQSKPIERAFRDMCDDIAKDPRFAGAYTGNSPVAHPENYGSRAVELEDFLAVLADGIHEHNARPGRRSETASGRSFIETFDDSYQLSSIRRATTEQRRLWLMGAEGLTPDRKRGAIKFQGNTYWAPWLFERAGEKVVARFDPGDLHAGLHVYSLANEYLGHVECTNKAGFDDMDAGREHNRRRKQFVKAERAALDAARKMRVAEIGDALDRASSARPQQSDQVKAKVVRGVFSDKPKKLPPAPVEPRTDEVHSATLARFEAAKRKSKEIETPRERFLRAEDLERRIEAGETIPAEQEQWLRIYRSEPEYRAEKRMNALYRQNSSG